MTPQDRVVQVRVPDYKNLLPKDSEAYRKTSFHDDFIVVDPHRWDGNMHEGTPNFDQIVEEGAFMPVDGELPWGTWSMNKENGDSERLDHRRQKDSTTIIPGALHLIKRHPQLQRARCTGQVFHDVLERNTHQRRIHEREAHAPSLTDIFGNTTAVLPKETHSNMCAIIWDTVSNCKNCKSTHSSIRITISSTFRSH